MICGVCFNITKEWGGRLGVWMNGHALMTVEAGDRNMGWLYFSLPLCSFSRFSMIKHLQNKLQPRVTSNSSSCFLSLTRIRSILSAMAPRFPLQNPPLQLLDSKNLHGADAILITWPRPAPHCSALEAECTPLVPMIYLGVDGHHTGQVKALSGKLGPFLWEMVVFCPSELLSWGHASLELWFSLILGESSRKEATGFPHGKAGQQVLGTIVFQHLPPCMPDPPSLGPFEFHQPGDPLFCLCWFELFHFCLKRSY